MAKLFFLFSGEYETLPSSELKAILEAEDYSYKVREKLDQTIRLEADSNCVEVIKRRAALTKLCAVEMFNCRAETNQIVRAASSADLNGLLMENESFAVRVKRVKNHAMKIDGRACEKRLGEIILDKTVETKVNLKNPDKTFIGILTEGKFVFGVRLAEILPTPFVKRRPTRKPYFHPSAMLAKLARCMVNLAKAKAGDLVFDPFCGTGGILVEAGLIGCRVLGSDIKRKMVKGTLQNLIFFKIEPEGLLMADAKNVPLKNVECIVTDPPYGRSATTMKRTTRRIIEEVFMSVHELLSEGRRVCIAAPKTLGVRHIGTAFGYKHIESHLVYVHRSLTREICVFEKG